MGINRSRTGRRASGRTARPGRGASKAAPKTSTVALDPDRIDRTAGGRRVSLRTVVLVGLGILLAAMFAPSVNTGITQWQQISALERDIEATESEVEALQHKQEQLSDPDYLAARAREEQNYVKPGEELYIVIDDAEEDTAAEADADRTPRPVRAQPWYQELVDSLQAVGFATEETR